jgi:cytoskeleton protein RodZ
LAVLPAVGEQLRAARKARLLEVADVAQALKLGPRQVEALENGDWEGLPGATFVRGFVRNYARLVQIDSGAVDGATR